MNGRRKPFTAKVARGLMTILTIAEGELEATEQDRSAPERDAAWTAISWGRDQIRVLHPEVIP